MPRRARRHAEGGFYHVTARGNDRHLVFLDIPDRQVFLAKLATATRRFDWRCLTYCLMGNHYHLVLRSAPAPLAAGMQMLNGTYATHFNRRHGRSGHLWQERFGSEAIRSDRQLLATMRYVALNPVQAGLCAEPEEWVWSGHRSLSGDRRDVVALDAALELFDSDPQVARRRYADFVGPRALAGAYVPTANEPSIWRPSIAQLVGQHGEEIGVAVANVDYAYSVRDIAHALGTHHATARRKVLRGCAQLPRLHR